jgi:hypothetical protein
MRTARGGEGRARKDNDDDEGVRARTRRKLGVSSNASSVVCALATVPYTGSW